MIKKNGFTLLELLITIVIIGIIASLAMPGFEKFKKKGYFAEAYTFISMIRKDEEIYYQETGSYCDDVSGLDVDLQPQEARKFLYSIDTDTGITDPPGFAYNNYIIIAHPNTSNPQMANIPEHPHVHSGGAIGLWESDSKPHSHESFSHTHVITYGYPY